MMDLDKLDDDADLAIRKQLSNTTSDVDLRLLRPVS